ncbi:MAG: malectin domain-containing carbohydrate-binding protein [Planctomycetota bacterium]
MKSKVQLLCGCFLMLTLASPGFAQATFARGDCNDDGAQNLTDNVYLLAYLFNNGNTPPCLSACDSNDDDAVNISDAVRHLSYLFTQGLPPEAPFPACGGDPTPGTIDCLATASCTDAPYFTTTPPAAASVGLLYFYDVDATDPQGTVVSYSLLAGPAGAGVDPTSGVLTWFPSGGDVADVTFTVRAIDGGGEFTDQDFTVSVGYRINCGEALVPYDDGTVLWTPDTGFDSATSAVFSSTDPVAGTTADPIYQRLRFANGAGTAYELPVANGDFRVRLLFAETFYTSAGQRGFTTQLEGCSVLTDYDIFAMAGGHDIAVVEEFIVSVQDGSLSLALLNTGPDVAILNAFEVTRTSAISSTPQITSFPATSTPSGSTYSYPLVVADANVCETFTYSLMQGPPTATISATGVIEWSPTSAAVGPHDFAVEVADSTGLTTAQFWTLQVVLSSAPVIVLAPAPQPHAAVGVPYSYDVTATDPGDTVTYTLEAPSPTTATIDPVSGLITWTPGPMDLGIQSVTVRATDSTGLSDVWTFAVETCYRINCGELLTDIVDTQGRDWAADFGFGGGIEDVAVGNPAIACAGGDDVLYQSRRCASAGNAFEYALIVPPTPACYEVRLYFAEIDAATIVGNRVFDVAFESATPLPAFDIVAAANVDCPAAPGGIMGAVVREVFVNVSDGTLNIALTSVASSACVSAIEVCEICSP